MFLRYGGSNFFCFKNDFEVDLRLNRNCPKGISKGKDYTNVLCIKGANAAGKTNALKALSIICNFLHDSFNQKPDASIGIESYFKSQDPSFLFCEFRVNDTEYRYELTLTTKTVLSEALIELGKSPRTLFKRDSNKVSEFDEEFSDLEGIPQIRSNASLISTAHQHQIECTEIFYKLFRNALYNVDYGGFRDLTYEGMHKFYSEDPSALDFVTEKAIKFDTGLSDIRIEQYINSEGEDVFYPVFEFKIDGRIKTLRLQEQSSGTRRLYYLLGFIYLVLNDNESLPFSATFIADELDLHLHSKILPELTRLFEESGNAQLIFSCQNDQILDSLGKYRTVMINKDDNESYSYRLDELPSDLLRNGRPISPHYANESIGGVPKIG